MILTVDANVFVAASKSDEPHHLACSEFFLQIAKRQDILECPNLMLVEIAAAVARSTRDPSLTQSFVQKIRANPSLRLKPLDGKLALASAQIAMNHFLRGADAVYIAVAQEVGGTLITLDAELRERGAAVVPTLTPDEWLKTLGAKS